jgi:hypothetical protein
MKLSKRHWLPCLLLGASLIAAQDADAQKAFRPELGQTLQALEKATPYQDNDGAVPPRSQYQGPLFVLNHAWPTTPLPPLKNAPWQVAIGNGKITPENAAAYAEALKTAVSANGRALIMHYDTWNAERAGWYNEPWLGSLRESIHGTYDAGEFGPGIFPNTGLHATFNTHVVTYYDARAAYTLRKVWAGSAMKPEIKTANTQFDEGAIVVKAAVFASEDVTQPLDWWDAMKGAQVWQTYIPVGDADPPPASQLWPGYVAQFDIIVKDSQSAPVTGWVYMTLVYDSAASGDIWDKMVPLGVQWGNDPQATAAGMPLKENWNNAKAPLYSTQTLGWGGRLSGPNDGARNDIAVDGVAMKNAPDSSCLSCHSTAQWNVQAHNMPSFLLPSFATPATATTPPFQTCDADGKPDPKNQGAYICSPAPGSAAWMKWFQDRPGTEPMDPGSVATDFDEVLSFKSLGLWWLAVGPSKQPAPVLLRNPLSVQRFNLYSGAPVPKP